MQKCDICGNENSLIMEENEGMCIKCGYSTSKQYRKDDQGFKQYLENIPKIMDELKIFDNSRDQYWLPTIVHTTKGMIFPVNSKNNWMWAVALYKKNEQGKYELDLDNQEYFFSDNYDKAALYLGIDLMDNLTPKSQADA